MGPGVVGVYGERPVQAEARLQKLYFAERGVVESQSMSGLQVVIVRQPHRGRLSKGALGLCLVHMHRKHRHDRSDDLVLDGKSVIELAIVAVGPPVRAGRGIDELGADADTVAGAANAALEHVAHPELTPNLPDIDGLALVLEARIAGDHKEFREPRQVCDDVVGDAVTEIVLTRVAAHVAESENSDRGLVREWEMGRGRL